MRSWLTPGHQQGGQRYNQGMTCSLHSYPCLWGLRLEGNKARFREGSCRYSWARDCGFPRLRPQTQVHTHTLPWPGLTAPAWILAHGGGSQSSLCDVALSLNTGSGGYQCPGSCGTWKGSISCHGCVCVPDSMASLNVASSALRTASVFPEQGPGPTILLLGNLGARPSPS